MLDSRRFTSGAALGFQVLGVLVYYSPVGQDNTALRGKFKEHGLQIAMAVPWQIDEEREGLKTFCLGLFGLDKMRDQNECVGVLWEALNAVLEVCGHVVVPDENKTKVA